MVVVVVVVVVVVAVAAAAAVAAAVAAVSQGKERAPRTTTWHTRVDPHIPCGLERRRPACGGGRPRVAPVLFPHELDAQPAVVLSC